jgi:uncharacterized protein (DUF2126 family)
MANAAMPLQCGHATGSLRIGQLDDPHGLCAEVRNGVFYLFMPPLSQLEHYLELVAAIEAVAEELKQPVLLEGYEPPHDPRLRKFSVTPDPGVIEVNIQPANNWSELVEQTTHLYDAARASRLTTESSCSMAITPAPAAATTWCWAASRPAIRPSCAGPTCCAA